MIFNPVKSLFGKQRDKDVCLIKIQRLARDNFRRIKAYIRLISRNF